MKPSSLSPVTRLFATTLFLAGLGGCSSSSSGSPDAGDAAPDASDAGMDTRSGNDSAANDAASADRGVDGNPADTGTAACNSTVAGGGARFAYVAAAGAGKILAYSVAASTGALTAIGSPVLTSSPRQLTVDPSNKFLLVAAFGTTTTCGTGCALVSYAIDPTSGALTPAGRGVAGTNPISLAVNATSTRVYTANTNSDDITIFTLDPATGAITASGTMAAGHFPEWITLSQDGKFLYVANTGSNNVSMFSVDATTGTLTSIGTVAAGTSPTFFIIHPNGKFAYVANPGSNNVSFYGRDATTGMLTPTADIPAGMTARSIALDPAGHFAYVADQTQIMTFAVDATNGSLTASGAPTPVSAGSQPYYLTTDPGGTHLYVGLQNTNATAPFAIDKTSGALCPVGAPVMADSDPLNIALMP
jgi:6-phosphogluconolactonase